MPLIWSGTLAFGLVAIPVQVQPAVHSHKKTAKKAPAKRGGKRAG